MQLDQLSFDWYQFGSREFDDLVSASCVLIGPIFGNVKYILNPVARRFKFLYVLLVSKHLEEREQP